MCLLPVCTESRDWQSHARARHVCLSALDARRAHVHTRCFGLISLDVLHVDVATVRRHETTNEMTTSEMTTSETTKTSEKKYQTSGCARGPKNCETNRPSAQAPDPKNSKRTQTRQELCHLLRYTNAEAATEATGSVDKMSEWPEGGIASAGNIVDKMSGCVRARLEWCPRS